MNFHEKAMNFHEQLDTADNPLPAHRAESLLELAVPVLLDDVRLQPFLLVDAHLRGSWPGQHRNKKYLPSLSKSAKSVHTLKNVNGHSELRKTLFNPIRAHLPRIR